MRYVIIRDDDTNALTPIECLERLYRPFLERGLPVNLAAIPDVATTAITADGKPEGFLLNKLVDCCGAAAKCAEGGFSSNGHEKLSSRASQIGERGLQQRPPVISAKDARSTNGEPHATVPMPSNPDLVHYLRENPEFHIVQHGLHHDYLEFDRASPVEVGAKFEEGTRLLAEAGFARPQTFVAPYDKLSRTSLAEGAKRFQVLSTGWYELRRLPFSWWPSYALKKAAGKTHWRTRGTILLTHPGCLLSYRRNYNTILNAVIQHVSKHRLTVLVTHWWEYFRDGRPDERFIEVLHETGNYLAKNREVNVISFEALLSGQVPLN
jgi:hypothetical protein